MRKGECFRRGLRTTASKPGLYMRALRIYYKNSLVFKFYSQEPIYFNVVPFVNDDGERHDWLPQLSDTIKTELRAIDDELRMLQLQDLDLNSTLFAGERRENIEKAIDFVDFIEKIRAAEPNAAEISGFLQYSVA